ncbi:MAG: DUF3536 domain-containing protein [Deltaproteobacteria bacterium]|jgi:hypothetical protein|nr:DUF3536 domain-containing protein [Deltaproteobacteria bacterium]
MKRKICIHGHFYQPPREDPWFGRIFLEPGAAPGRHWNARITRESYAPLAWSRRLDSGGRIADLVNCYEWISFNVGPTLMLWLEREEPGLLARIQEADRLSMARWGHGNALAQVFHHVILPLASPLDKEAEISWAVADFQARFRREPEGIWLSECAVDAATLEVVAERGFSFVVLSPHQAAAVSLEGGPYTRVDARTLDVGRPYFVVLPSGRRLAIFFYQAELAQNVAFEGLLGDGERFWQKLSRSASALRGENALLTLATDGETYGHHFTFGEMALAYVLAQGYAGRDGLSLTNFGAYLEENPPTAEARLHTPSSWSCSHGVERWRGDCGCSTGAHPGWKQTWRAPLRRALDRMKSAVDAHYFARGEEVFKDARAALLDYGRVLVAPSAGPDFLEKHLRDKGGAAPAWSLLRMQESALSAYASCAWFFDELSRIEPVNAMRFMSRALDIMKSDGGPDMLPDLEKALGEAFSNKAEEGSGRDIFLRRVLPARQDPASVCLFGYLLAFAERRLPAPGGEAFLRFPGLSLSLTPLVYAESGCSGIAGISVPEAGVSARYSWSGILPFPGRGEYISFREASLEAREENPASSSGRAFRRQGSGLAGYLLDYLGLRLLELSIRARRGDCLAVARQLVSTLRAPEEGQSTRNASPLWSAVAPYLPLAAYVSAPLPDELSALLREVLSRCLEGREARQLARDFLEEAVLEDLRLRGRSDADLCAALRQVKLVFEDMDWWRVQNALWQGGGVCPDYPRAAAELGFRL